MNTDFIFILDGSGSMSKLKAEVLSSYNALIEEQRSVRGEARITLVRFSGSDRGDYQVLLHRVPLPLVLPLRNEQYLVSGWTALRDAIGKTLSTLGPEIRREGWANQVVVSVLTDGEENRSKEFSGPELRRLIGEYQALGWVFTFSGANIDSFAAAREYGIDETYVSNFEYTGEGLAQTMGATSATLRKLRGITF